MPQDEPTSHLHDSQHPCDTGCVVCNLHACRVDLACPASPSQHDPACPWHADNITTLTLPAAEFDALQRELASPPRHLPRLAALLKERRAQ